MYKYTRQNRNYVIPLLSRENVVVRWSSSKSFYRKWSIGEFLQSSSDDHRHHRDENFSYPTKRRRRFPVPQKFTVFNGPPATNSHRSTLRSDLLDFFCRCSSPFFIMFLHEPKVFFCKLLYTYVKIGNVYCAEKVDTIDLLHFNDIFNSNKFARILYWMKRTRRLCATGARWSYYMSYAIYCIARI